MQLKFKRLHIPFRHQFSHASATRSQTDSLLVQAKLEGLSGYGEGCPRLYVTGETMDSACEFLATVLPSVSNIENVLSLKDWVVRHSVEIDQNPSAWCAVELAMLDLFGKRLEIPIEKLLSQSILLGNFQYTAVLGAANESTFGGQLAQYVAMGFEQYKLKLTGQLQQDQARIDALFSSHSSVQVRVDANNLWPKVAEPVDYFRTLNRPVLGIEEPLQARDFDGHKAFFDALGTPIILDESFTKFDDFQGFRVNSNASIINIRISKMGGLIRALAIAKEAERLGIPIIVGAHVGETSLLSRAALCVANANRHNLIGQEGAFGEYLLTKDIARSAIEFSHKGQLNTDLLGQQSGLGVEMCDEVDLFNTLH